MTDHEQFRIEVGPRSPHQPPLRDSAMRRPRITIASLLGIVAFVGVAIAALREPTDAWDATLLGLTVLVLLASALLAVHRRGGGGAFWRGFALLGWAYLVASLAPPVEIRLPTRRGFDLVGSILPPQTIDLT